MDGHLPPSMVVGDWLLEQKIGRGSFAVVWKARHRTSGQVVAVKEIATDKLNQKLKQSLECEISILKRVEHRNIVRLLDTREERNRMYLVMEYCAGGDLAAFIKRCKRVPEGTAHALMRQLAAGLREMWAHNLVHRDLKPQNLLLSTAGSGAVLKIADFGFARNLQPAGLAETLCGSPLYMAPEILQFHKYDAKADLWSVGTILYELVVGRPPFNGANHLQLLRNIERAEAKVPDVIAAQLSPSCCTLLAALLQRNPVERISFEEFFAHPFLHATPAASSGKSPAEAGAAAKSGERLAGGASLTGSGSSAATGFRAEADPCRGLRATGQLPFELPDSDAEGDAMSGAHAAFAGHRLLGPKAPALGRAAARAAPSAGAVPGQAPLQARLDALPGPATPTLASGRGVAARVSNSRPAQRPAEDPCDEDDYVIISSVGSSSRGGGSGASSAAGSRRSSLASAWHPLAGGPPPSAAPSAAGVTTRQRATQQAEARAQAQQQAQNAQQHGSSNMARSLITSQMQALAKELSGGSRADGWELAAQVLEGRAAAHQAAGRLPEALVLRLLALQLLQAALQAAKASLAASSGAASGASQASVEGGSAEGVPMHTSGVSMSSSPAFRAPGPPPPAGSSPGGTGTDVRPAAASVAAQVARLAARQRVVAGRAEKVGAALAERGGGGGELPESWELAHQDALELARTGAVEETLGNHATSRDAYAQAGALLHFMMGDAGELPLEPRLRLPPAARARLARYFAGIASRFAACTAVLQGDPAYAAGPASVGLLQRFA